VVQTIIGESDLASRGVLLLVEFAARCIQVLVLLTVLLLTNWQTPIFIALLGVIAFGLSWGARIASRSRPVRSRQMIRRGRQRSSSTKSITRPAHDQAARSRHGAGASGCAEAAGFIAWSTPRSRWSEQSSPANDHR
jgi:hypothetical protein